MLWLRHISSKSTKKKWAQLEIQTLKQLLNLPKNTSNLFISALSKSPSLTQIAKTKLFQAKAKWKLYSDKTHMNHRQMEIELIKQYNLEYIEP